MRIGLYLEYDGKKLTASSDELLAMVKDSDYITEVTVFAANADEAELGQLAVDKAVYIENAFFAKDIAGGIMLKADLWDWFMFPMTLNGREIGAYLNSMLNGELVYGVGELKKTDTGIKVTKLTAGGLAREFKVFAEDEKVILGIVPELWNEKTAETGSCEVERIAVSVNGNVELKKEYLASWCEISVSEAKVVVSGGNGMAEKEKFDLLYSLGEHLEAPVGGSRVAEDKGWIQHKAMIGATGSVIAPKLYIACGISGAVQHMVGVMGSERIIAVNKDAMCAMMQNSDLAVVCDCNELLPVLLEELKKYKRTEAI